uniref:DUF4219 domain-containing protein n=1 Tax=Setaria viridis TaxID=4556 RepID=A0A4U6STH0_SETVI|nr:hypothetical protein SEVIR_9G088100v2 [Setaria viridis]
MADLASACGGIKKLYNHNYGYWKTYMKSYLQGQDLWEVVAGAETVPPPKETNKAMFVLKATIEEDLLEHIRDAETQRKL